MKVKQTNAEGVEEEVEVMTQAEVDAKLASEKAALEAGHKDELGKRDADLAAAATEKSRLEGELAAAKVAGMKEDHPNFKILKDALDKKDKEMGDLKGEIEKDRTSRKQESMNAEIKIVAKGDKELEDKIKLHLKDTLSALPEDTAEQRTVKLAAAFKLSSNGTEGPGMFDGGTGGGGFGGNGGGEGSGIEFTAREKALGAKMGISAEDYKKYGPKLKTNKK